MVERDGNGTPRRGSKRLLAELSGRIRALEAGSRAPRGHSDETSPPVPSGLVALQGLERGVLHEFCGVGGGSSHGDSGHGDSGRGDSGRGDSGRGGSRGGRPSADWAPPIALLVHLARCTLESGAIEGTAGGASSVLWIGRRLWPYPAALADAAALVESDGRCRRVENGDENGDDGAVRGDRTLLLERSLFVDPGSRALVWAADRALRCAGSAVVAIDGRGLDLGTTRRLQLAAEAGGALALVARPADDARRPSVAASRWLVERAQRSGAAADDDAPAWNLTPLKRRAVRWHAHGAATNGAAVNGAGTNGAGTNGRAR